MVNGQIYVDGSNIDGDDDGTTWATAYRYLQDAISVSSSGNEIHVAAGTYYPDEGTDKINNSRIETFNIPSGIALYGGYPCGGGTQDYISNETILSGEIQQDGTDSNNSYNVIKFISVNDQTVLYGFTISDGYSSSDGGGIYIYNYSYPLIEHCILENNYASNSGGAIASNYYAAPAVNACLFKK